MFVRYNRDVTHCRHVYDDDHKQLNLLTYLLIPWSRVVLEKLTGFAANQEIPRLLWNPKVHHRTHKRPPPVCILNQIHQVHTTLSHFLKNKQLNSKYITVCLEYVKYITVFNTYCFGYTRGI